MSRIVARTNSQDDNCSFAASDVVYDGLELFKKGKRLKSVLEAPGVAESKVCLFALYFNSNYANAFIGGWKVSHLNKPIGLSACMNSLSAGSTSHSAERERDALQAKLNNSLKTILDKIINSKNSWAFLEPLDKREVS